MHTPKEIIGITKSLPTFSNGNSKKVKHFYGHKGKEGMGILKVFDRFYFKKWKFPFFVTVFDIKN